MFAWGLDYFNPRDAFANKALLVITGFGTTLVLRTFYREARTRFGPSGCRSCYLSSLLRWRRFLERKPELAVSALCQSDYEWKCSGQTRGDPGGYAVI